MVCSCFQIGISSNCFTLEVRNPVSVCVGVVGEETSSRISTIVLLDKEGFFSLPARKGGVTLALWRSREPAIPSAALPEA